MVTQTTLGERSRSASARAEDAELERYCREAVGEAAGLVGQRSNLWTSANRGRQRSTAPITSEPAHTRVRQSAARDNELVLRWPGKPVLSLPLGTRNLEEAGRRADLVLEWIRTAVTAGRSIDKKKILELLNVSVGVQAAVPWLEAARNEPIELGPVEIAVSRVHGRQPRLKCYVHVTGRPDKGYRLMVDFATAAGSARERFACKRFAVEPAEGNGGEQMESLRLQLRDFLRVKLTAFFAAGGGFDARDLPGEATTASGDCRTMARKSWTKREPAY